MFYIILHKNPLTLMSPKRDTSDFALWRKEENAVTGYLKSKKILGRLLKE
jgi:hypothetical protein